MPRPDPTEGDLEIVREGLRQMAETLWAVNVILAAAIAAREAERAAAKAKEARETKRAAKPRRKRAPRLRWEKTVDAWRDSTPDDSAERLAAWEEEHSLRVAKAGVRQNEAIIKWAARLAEGRKPRRKRA